MRHILRRIRHFRNAGLAAAGLAALLGGAMQRQALGNEQCYYGMAQNCLSNCTSGQIGPHS